jgi:hypothetical protein
MRLVPGTRCHPSRLLTGAPRPADTRRGWKLRELQCAKDSLAAGLAAAQADGALLQSRLAHSQDRLAAARAELQVGRRPLQLQLQLPPAAASGSAMRSPLPANAPGMHAAMRRAALQAKEQELASCQALAQQQEADLCTLKAAVDPSMHAHAHLR